MERKYRTILAALAILFVSVAAHSALDQPRTATFVDENGSELATITYESAVSDEEKRRGLMFRESLDENHGMIFVYSQERPRSFWMKNTLIPLDIIFLDSNRTVINIEKAYPEPGVSDENLERYSSESPAQYVIEVNQNFTERNKIGKGDRVKFTLSR